MNTLKDFEMQIKEEVKNWEEPQPNTKRNEEYWARCEDGDILPIDELGEIKKELDSDLAILKKFKDGEYAHLEETTGPGFLKRTRECVQASRHFLKFYSLTEAILRKYKQDNEHKENFAWKYVLESEETTFLSRRVAGETKEKLIRDACEPKPAEDSCLSRFKKDMKVHGVVTVLDEVRNILDATMPLIEAIENSESGFGEKRPPKYIGYWREQIAENVANVDRLTLIEQEAYKLKEEISVVQCEMQETGREGLRKDTTTSKEKTLVGKYSDLEKIRTRKRGEYKAKFEAYRDLVRLSLHYHEYLERVMPEADWSKDPEEYFHRRYSSNKV